MLSKELFLSKLNYVTENLIATKNTLLEFTDSRLELKKLFKLISNICIPMEHSLKKILKFFQYDNILL